MDEKRVAFHYRFGRLRIDFIDKIKWIVRLYSGGGTVLAHCQASGSFKMPPLLLGDRNEITCFIKTLKTRLPLILKVIKNMKSCQAQFLGLCILGGESAIELLKDCQALAVLIAHKRPTNCVKFEEAQSIQHLVKTKLQYLLFRNSFPSQKWVARG